MTPATKQTQSRSKMLRLVNIARGSVYCPDCQPPIFDSIDIDTEYDSNIILPLILFPYLSMSVSKFTRMIAVVAGIGMIAMAAVLPLPTTSDVSVPTAGAAQADYYLKLEGVDGESASDTHKGEIDIQSFSWGVSQTAMGSTGGGAGSGKAKFDGLQVTKRIDKASPLFFLAAATGKHFPKATLVGSKDGVEFLKITLSDVMVSSFSEKGDNTMLPQDQLSFNYAKIEFEYFPRSSAGQQSQSVKAGWDVKANKKI